MNHSSRIISPISVGADQLRMPVIPDRSVVISADARKALEDVLVAGRWHWRLEAIDPQSVRVLAALLRLYARDGHPPSLPDLAINVGIPEALADELLDRLARHDLVLLRPGEKSICGAYPFSEKKTGHAVTFGNTGKRLNTMCAIDALGAGAMCREDVSIQSICRFCGNDIVAETGDHGMSLREIRPSEPVVWAGLRQSCGCAADTLCAELLLFCSAEHLNGWRSQGHGAKGHMLTVDEGFQIGKALFIDRAMMSSR